VRDGKSDDVNFESAFRLLLVVFGGGDEGGGGKSWTFPYTSTTSPALSKTPCALYGVIIKIDNETLNNLLPPKMDSQLIRPYFVPQDFLGRHATTSQARILDKTQGENEAIYFYVM